MADDRFSYPDPKVYSGTLRFVEYLQVFPKVSRALEYSPPVKIVANATEAGEVVEISGRNFGPSTADRVVTFGPEGQTGKFTCTPVHVDGIWNHSTIRCLVGAGSGANLQFMVSTNVGAEIRTWGADRFSYPPPILTPSSIRYDCPSGQQNTVSVVHDHQGTLPAKIATEGSWTLCMNASSNANATGVAGGDVMLLDGKYFGPYLSDISVTYGRPFSPLKYTPTLLAPSTNQFQLQLRTVPGMGRALIFTVVVGGQTFEGSDEYNYPSLGNTDYNRTCAATTFLSSSSLTIATAGLMQRFYIMARDDNGIRVPSGGNIFTVLAAGAQTQAPATVQDNYDGSYSAFVTYTRSGFFSISIRMSPLMLHVKGSPFGIEVLTESIIYPSNNQALTVASSQQTAGEQFTFFVRSADRFGNQLYNVSHLYYLDMFGADPTGNRTQHVDGTIVVESTGVYRVAMNATVSGDYQLRLTYNGTKASESPYSLRVVPSIAIANSSLLTGDKRRAGNTDEPEVFVITLADTFGNLLTNGGYSVVAIVADGPDLDRRSIQVNDRGDGNFDLVTFITISGTYSIAVGLGDISQTLPFSPLSLQVDAGTAVALLSGAQGDAIRYGIAGKGASFDVTLRDLFGNVITSHGQRLEVNLYIIDGMDYIFAPSNATFADGKYVGSYYQVLSDRHILSVVVGGQHIFGSPFQVDIFPAEVHAGECGALQTTVLGVDAAAANGLFQSAPGGIRGGPPNRAVKIVIISRDRYRNIVSNIPDLNFTVSTAPAFNVAVVVYLQKGVFYTEIMPTAQATDPYSITVNIALNGVHIAGSPFASTIRKVQGAILAANCQVLWPGSRTMVAGKPKDYIIQAIDTYGSLAVTGGLTFGSTVSYSQLIASSIVTDQGSGSYTATLLATVTGTYTATASLLGTAVSGSPFTIKVLPDVTSPADCTVVGTGLTAATSGSETMFVIESRDKFSNRQLFDPALPGVPFIVVLDGAVRFLANTTDLRNATYAASYSLTVSGNYTVRITTTSADGNRPVSNGSYLLTVYPLGPFAPLISSYGPALSRVAAGVDGRFNTLLRDTYNNPVTARVNLTVWADNLLVRCLPGNASSAGEVATTFTLTRSGQYAIVVRIQEALYESPIYSVLVTPGSVSALQTSLIWSQADTNWSVDGPSTGIIQAADAYANIISTGGLSFAVRVVGSSNIQLEASIIDRLNGTYLVNLGPLRLGNFSVSASLLGSGAINTTNVTVSVGYMSSKGSSALTATAVSTAAGSPASVVIVPRDSLYYQTSRRGGPVKISVSPEYGTPFASISDTGTQVSLTVHTTRAATYAISVVASGPGMVGGTPFSFKVSPGPVDVTLTELAGPGLSLAVAGSATTFAVTARDGFGNAASFDPFVGSQPFTLNVVSDSDSSVVSSRISPHPCMRKARAGDYTKHRNNLCSLPSFYPPTPL